MAITIDDFSKIWASTSPLTPYSFSDSNYQEGWNFVGNTPPSRQMWDFIQKQNDEKLKYLLDNFNDYLPKSGGTMTGAITLADGGNPLSTAGGTMTGDIELSDTKQLKNTVDNGYLRFQGGTGDGNGARVVLSGKDRNSNNGDFEIVANDGTNSKTLLGKPDGTLTWDGKTVIVGTEATETTTFASISGGAFVTFAVAHNPKYYSVSLGGTGFAEMCVNKDSNRTFYVRNIGNNTRTNITLTVEYIY